MHILPLKGGFRLTKHHWECNKKSLYYKYCTDPFPLGVSWSLDQVRKLWDLESNNFWPTRNIIFVFMGQ